MNPEDKYKKELDPRGGFMGNLFKKLNWFISESSESYDSKVEPASTNSQQNADESFISAGKELVQEILGDDIGGDTANVDSTGNSVLDRLKPIIMWSNWKVRKQELPHFLLRGQSDLLNGLLTSMVNYTQATPFKPGWKRTVGWAWDSDSKENSSRTIRILDELGEGHKVATDVTLSSSGGDLYVRLDCLAWTKIQLLRKTMAYAAFVIGFLGAFLVLVFNGNLLNTWIKAIATEQASKDGYSTSTSWNGGGVSTNFSNAQALEFLILYGNRPRLQQQRDLFLNVLLFKEKSHSISLAEKYQLVIDNVFNNAVEDAKIVGKTWRDLTTHRLAGLKGVMTDNDASANNKVLAEMSFWNFVISENFNPSLARTIEEKSRSCKTVGDKVRYSIEVAELYAGIVDGSMYPLNPPNGVKDPRPMSCRPMNYLASGFNKLYQKMPREVQQSLFSEFISKFETPIAVLGLCGEVGQQRLRVLVGEYAKDRPNSPDPVTLDLPLVLALVKAGALKAVELLKYPAIVAGMLAAGVMFMPNGLLGVFCRFAGFPLPSDFENEVSSQSTSVEALLGEILKTEYGVTREMQFEIRAKR